VATTSAATLGSPALLELRARLKELVPSSDSWLELRWSTLNNGRNAMIALARVPARADDPLARYELSENLLAARSLEGRTQFTPDITAHRRLVLERALDLAERTLSENGGELGDFAMREQLEAECVVALGKRGWRTSLEVRGVVGLRARGNTALNTCLVRATTPGRLVGIVPALARCGVFEAAEGDPATDGPRWCVHAKSCNVHETRDVLTTPEAGFRVSPRGPRNFGEAEIRGTMLVAMVADALGLEDGAEITRIDAPWSRTV